MSTWIVSEIFIHRLTLLDQICRIIISPWVIKIWSTCSYKNIPATILPWKQFTLHYSSGKGGLVGRCCQGYSESSWIIQYRQLNPHATIIDGWGLVGFSKSHLYSHLYSGGSRWGRNRRTPPLNFDRLCFFYSVLYQKFRMLQNKTQIARESI